MYKLIIILLAGPLTYLVLEVLYQIRKRENISFCTENIVEVCEFFMNNKEALNNNNNGLDACIENKRVVLGKYAIYYNDKEELRKKLSEFSIQLYDYCTDLQKSYGDNIIPYGYKEEILRIGRELRKINLELS